MKINKVMPTKPSTGQKRKLFDPNAVQIVNKPLENNVERAKKAPLKAEIISNLKALEKKHEELKQENQQLKKRIAELEDQAKQIKMMEKCTEEAEELDLSFGPRTCEKCGYEAEDGYQLDGHFWSEHDEDDEEQMELFHCQNCDKTFSTMNDLMVHKKKKHVDIVDICWNFSNDACPFGDEKCWFQHKIKQTGTTSIK